MVSSGLTAAGYASVHAFLERGLFEKNAVYGVFGASRLLTLESTQSLAVALRRNPAQVVPIWTRAKEARDRAALAAQRAEESKITSWAEIPKPSLALRNLLEAQSASVERLPYELLAVREPACRRCTCDSRSGSRRHPIEPTGKVQPLLTPASRSGPSRLLPERSSRFLTRWRTMTTCWSRASQVQVSRP